MLCMFEEWKEVHNKPLRKQHRNHWYRSSFRSTVLSTGQNCDNFFGKDRCNVVGQIIAFKSYIESYPKSCNFKQNTERHKSKPLWTSQHQPPPPPPPPIHPPPNNAPRKETTTVMKDIQIAATYKLVSDASIRYVKVHVMLGSRTFPCNSQRIRPWTVTLRGKDVLLQWKRLFLRQKKYIFFSRSNFTQR
jgi:hypothetical protein